MAKQRSDEVGEKAKARSRQRAKATRDGGDLSFGPRNYVVFAGALISIALGFLLLSRGSITAAPLLLVLGYCVLVPYGLATGQRADSSGE